jgi:hypothetical protein
MLNNNKSVNLEVLDSVFETLNPSYAVLEARQTNKSAPNQIKPHPCPASSGCCLECSLWVSGSLTKGHLLVFCLTDHIWWLSCDLGEEFYIQSTADNSDTIFLRLHFPLFDARKSYMLRLWRRATIIPLSN